MKMKMKWVQKKKKKKPLLKGVEQAADRQEWNQ